MSKKWWPVIAVGFLLIAAVGVAIPMLMPLSPGVTYRNYSRLEKGMTKNEVEAILGPPSNDRPTLIGRGTGRTSISWGDEVDIVWIYFDEGGRANAATWNGILETRSGWQKLMDRVPWLAKDPPPRLTPVTVR